MDDSDGYGPVAIYADIHGRNAGPHILFDGRNPDPKQPPGMVLKPCK